MTTPARAPRRTIAALIAVSILAAIVPVSVDAAGPVTTSVFQATAPRTYRLDLGARADFVAQTNFVQCVGASMQMMLNMIQPGRDRTAATQLRLQKLARTYSGPRPDGTSRKGASVHGWAAGLQLLGAGPYRVVGEDTLQEALVTAARAIRYTGRPVGLLVWRGRHAWVMSGFTASADPMTTFTFKVTSAIVEDPLYPYGSSVWGRSPTPGQALTPKQLGKQFVPRRSSARWAAVQPANTLLNAKFVLVLPYQPDEPVAAARVY